MERKFKIGDQVIPALNTSWVDSVKYRTVINIFEKGYRLTETETEGIHRAIWYDDELELYKEKEEKRTYNLTEALKLPVGTKLKITYSDGSETIGYVGKYDLEEGENNVLLIGSLKEEARVTGHLANATYTVIEEQKPISFFEAVEQANGKKFKIEHRSYTTKNRHTLLAHINMFKELNNDEVRDIMLNAKCYLEN